MTLSQLREAGNHAVLQSDFAPEAKKRLEELRLDDLEKLWSFRVGARGRFWCIKDQNIYALLWWDPNHQVCLSLKKHT